ncbi:hypothetical protein WJX72_006319 [[Myrmecia] bisecta]|uniref:Uncharacterized protein n=1 Tax=[Myrmecia] bisecta TaxID=41462 RepID=A0AAW1R7K4_9CHLO
MTWYAYVKEKAKPSFLRRNLSYARRTPLKQPTTSHGQVRLSFPCQQYVTRPVSVIAVMCRSSTSRQRFRPLAAQLIHLDPQAATAQKGGHVKGVMSLARSAHKLCLLLLVWDDHHTARDHLPADLGWALKRSPSTCACKDVTAELTAILAFGILPHNSEVRWTRLELASVHDDACQVVALQPGTARIEPSTSAAGFRLCLRAARNPPMHDLLMRCCSLTGLQHHMQGYTLLETACSPDQLDEEPWMYIRVDKKALCHARTSVGEEEDEDEDEDARRRPLLGQQVKPIASWDLHVPKPHRALRVRQYTLTDEERSEQSANLPFLTRLPRICNVEQEKAWRLGGETLVPEEPAPPPQPLPLPPVLPPPPATKKRKAKALKSGQPMHLALINWRRFYHARTCNPFTQHEVDSILADPRSMPDSDDEEDMVEWTKRCRRRLDERGEVLAEVEKEFMNFPDELRRAVPASAAPDSDEQLICHNSLEGQSSGLLESIQSSPDDLHDDFEEDSNGLDSVSSQEQPEVIIQSFLAVCQSGQLVTALSALYCGNKLPVGHASNLEGTWEGTVGSTMAAMLALCQRANLAASELNSTTLLTALWICEAVDNQRRQYASTVPLDYLSYASLRSTKKEALGDWRSKLCSCQVDLLRRCEWNVLLKPEEILTAERQLRAKPHSQQLASICQEVVANSAFRKQLQQHQQQVAMSSHSTTKPARPPAKRALEISMRGEADSKPVTRSRKADLICLAEGGSSLDGSYWQVPDAKH